MDLSFGPQDILYGAFIAYIYAGLCPFMTWMGGNVFY